MDLPIKTPLLFAFLLLAACNAGGASERQAGPAAAGSGQPGTDSGSTNGASAGPAVSGMSTNNTGAGPAAANTDAGPPPFKISGRALVQWKRYAAFEADLMAALQLSRDQLCVEVGGKNCIRDVHLVPLGGNEPYESGLTKPSAEPLATTASVVDRVLLSACSTRARLDAEGAPQVFTALNLNAALPPASEPAIASTIRELYHRLLARDPAPREIELVAGLAEGGEDAPLSARDFAALACFTIGSMTEFLFF